MNWDKQKWCMNTESWHSPEVGNRMGCRLRAERRSGSSVLKGLERAGTCKFVWGRDGRGGGYGTDERGFGRVKEKKEQTKACFASF
ncbi:hypothetical protein MA16_Dca027919 [Dendrobium catenatum]|uniref:Uncharacterized protein n=1 Tax=Dendrobium catenatum TaxID=906689 RepID=A0A2I0VBP3_9ASPA|nr:hypothetical protein MA16_Dca027919 [Dendrobium catenatum]